MTLTPKKFSQFIPVTYIDGTEIIPIVQGGTNQTVRISTIIGGKADTSALKPVAFSGSYTDLINQPLIPTVPVKSVAGRIGDVVLTKTDVGLSAVDNTSDANKPVSTATQTALNAKEPTIAPGTSSQYYRGDKTFQTLDKTAVGLANVDNTSDASKPISSATQTALNATEKTANKGSANGYAPLDANSKVPTANLPSSVLGALNYQGMYDASTGAYPASPSKGYYYIVSTAGTITGTSYKVGDWLVYDGSAWEKVDNSQNITSVNGKTGVVSLTTTDISEGTNQYYTNARASAAAPVQSVAGKTGTVTLAEADVTGLVSDLAAKAPLASPALTGAPTAPTATAGTSNTQVATTAFVGSAVTAGATPDATTTTKGKIQLAGDLAGTADAPTTPTAVHKTGAETITSTKTFTAEQDFGAGGYTDPSSGKTYDAKFGGSNYGVAVKGDSFFGGNVGLGTSTPAEKLEIVGSNATVRVKNTGDALGGFVGSSFAAVQIGMYNPTATDNNAVPAGTKRTMLAVNSTGKVGSVTNAFGNPSFRNVLDDGTGAASISGAISASVANVSSLKVTTGAGAGKTLYSDSAGNATWAVPKSGIIAFNASDYGAIGDGAILADGAMTSGSSSLTSASAVFSATDVGKVISVIGAGASGAPLSTTIASYVSSTNVTLTASAGTTVTGARTVYGTENGSLLQAAFSALPATSGGRLYVPTGIYTVSTRLNITQSNILIEFAPGVVIIAVARPDSSFKSEYRGILHLQLSGTGSTQRNVTINGGVIDCNFQPTTTALSLWGSGNDTTVYSTQNITFNNMYFRNKGNSTASPAIVQYHSITDLNLGRIKEIKMRNCTIDTTDTSGLMVRGTYKHGIYVEDCEFMFIQIFSITQNLGSETSNATRVDRRWYIRRNYFHDTMLANTTYTLYDFGMISRIGIESLYIQDNTFDSRNEYNPNDNPNLQIYASYDVSIERNSFKYTRQALSLGYSNNATVLYNDYNQVIKIANNNFYYVYSTLTDMDSNTRCLWNGNIFYECGVGAFNAYSVHAFDIIENNLFYNMQGLVESDAAFAMYQPQATVATYPEQYKSSFSIGGGNQMVVQNNVFVDDRYMNNPTATASSDWATVTGGTMAARTYYYRYAYGNVSGTTACGPSQSFSVPANTLAKITPTKEFQNSRPSNLTAGIPPVGNSGIRFIQIYVGTAAGSEKLQTTLSYPDFQIEGNGWTEPTTGLVAGASVPASNTTHNMTKYGIYELTNGGGYLGPNIYSNNHFYGFLDSQMIYTPNPTTTRWVRYGNTNSNFSTGVTSNDTHAIYQQGSVTGATTYTRQTGEVNQSTLTGNIVITLTNHYVSGDTLVLQLTQGGSGGYSATWTNTNIVFTNGGAPNLSTAVGATDNITFLWDGAYWRETTRAMATLATIDGGSA